MSYTFSGGEGDVAVAAVVFPAADAIVVAACCVLRICVVYVCVTGNTVPVSLPITV